MALDSGWQSLVVFRDAWIVLTLLGWMAGLGRSDVPLEMSSVSHLENASKVLVSDAE